ncbi:MAG TPA: MOSC domain-containing protein [Planctomycetota bacterium]|nr:MOSC domain-containing protein [Planctomycetota bacterium]
MRPAGKIASLNVSRGGVPKRPVKGARIGTLGLEGDAQKHTRIHGGPDRAVCIYSAEGIAWLNAEGHAVVPGALGENVTTEGVDLAALAPGSRLRLGGAVVLEVASYASPCNQIAACFADRRVHPIEPKERSRLYARVIEGGEVKVGDEVVVL